MSNLDEIKKLMDSVFGGAPNRSAQMICGVGWMREQQAKAGRGAEFEAEMDAEAAVAGREAAESSLFLVQNGKYEVLRGDPA